MDIIDDQSVKEMFKVHKSELVINLFVLDMDIIPNEVGNNLNGQSFQENLGINNNAGRQIEYFQNSGDDDEYYHSSSDESWKHHLGSDKEDGSDDDRGSLASSDSNDLNFADFKENEDGDVVPASDSECEKVLDPMKEVMKSKMWTYNPRDKIEFDKGRLFTNIDAFRAALKDYVIQKGFPIVRLKNEKIRCTAKCGAQGCNWRIHASPIANSVTFMIKSCNPEYTSNWIAKDCGSYIRLDCKEVSDCAWR